MQHHNSLTFLSQGSEYVHISFHVRAQNAHPNSFVLLVERAEDSESSAQLLRTKSDAGVLRRGQRRSPSNQRKIRRHRFSINGHFYNHKVVFANLQKMKILISPFTFCPLNLVFFFFNYIVFACFCVPDSSFYTCLWLGH